MIAVLVHIVRLLTFMRVQPRVAVLFKTIHMALDDLFHFLLMFCIMYCFLSFLAKHMFGADLEEFGTFRNALEPL